MSWYIFAEIIDDTNNSKNENVKKYLINYVYAKYILPFTTEELMQIYKKIYDYFNKVGKYDVNCTIENYAKILSDSLSSDVNYHIAILKAVDDACEDCLTKHAYYKKHVKYSCKSNEEQFCMEQLIILRHVNLKARVLHDRIPYTIRKLFNYNLFEIDAVSEKFNYFVFTPYQKEVLKCYVEEKFAGRNTKAAVGSK